MTKRRYVVGTGFVALWRASERVPATGDLGRWMVLPFGLAVLWFGVAALIGAAQDPASMTAYFFVLSAVSVVVSTVTVGRAPFWGVRVGADFILIISWWRSYRVPFGDVFAVRHVEYEGLIVGAGDPLFGSRLRMIRLKLNDGEELDFPGTLFRRGNVGKIVPPLKDAMGIRHPTRP